MVEDYARRFRESSSTRLLDDDERARVEAAYRAYLDTVPDSKRMGSLTYDLKDVVGSTGFGIGSAGLPAYRLLVEGHTQALENDVVLTMKQGNVPAVGRVFPDEHAESVFEHQGHRTAISQRALQAHADPWLGWVRMEGGRTTGSGSSCASCRPTRPTSTGPTLTEPDEIDEVLDAARPGHGQGPLRLRRGRRVDPARRLPDRGRHRRARRGPRGRARRRRRRVRPGVRPPGPGGPPAASSTRSGRDGSPGSGPATTDGRPAPAGGSARAATWGRMRARARTRRPTAPSAAPPAPPTAPCHPHRRRRRIACRTRSRESSPAPRASRSTLETIIVPDPGPGEAVVDVQACGVCHTDLHYREGGIGDDFPFLLGHEAAGRGRGASARASPTSSRATSSSSTGARSAASAAPAGAGGPGTASPPTTPRRR